MSTQPVRTLLVSGGTESGDQLAAYLQHAHQQQVGIAATCAAALTQIEQAQGHYDVVFLADSLAFDQDGRLQAHATALITALKACEPAIEFILGTSQGRSASVTALRAGAYCCVRQPLDSEELALLIANAAEHRQLKRVAHEKQVLEQVARENARLKISEQVATLAASRHARNLKAVQEIAAAINSTPDLDQTLDTVCRAAVDLFGVDHSGLVFFEPDCERGEVAAEYPAIGARGIEIPVRGVPAEEQLIATRQPLVIDEITAADALRLGPVMGIFTRLDIRSLLIVPVISKGRVLGSFSLDSIGRPCRFAPETIELCRIFADQIAVAVEKTRLFTETRQRAEQLETLRRTALAITSRLDHATLLKTIIQQAVTLLNARGGGIYTYDAARGELELIADHGHPSDVIGSTLRVGEGMAGRLVAESAPFMIVPNYRQWPGRAAIYAEECPFEAVIAVPLRWAERTIGVLYVDDAVGRAFTAHDADLLRLFADHAAIAINNAEQVRAIKEVERQLRFMLQVSTSVAQAASLPEALQSLAELLMTFVNTTFCRIFLLDEQRQSLLALAASPARRQAGRAILWQPVLASRADRAEWLHLEVAFASSGPTILRATEPHHQQWLMQWALKSGLRTDIQSLLLMPLRSGQDVVGLLELGEARRWERAAFSAEQQELVAAIAGQTAALIDRMRLQMISERRERLLAALDAAARNLRAEKEPAKLQQEVLQLAVDVVGYTTGGLFLNRPQLAEVQLANVYELPPELIGSQQPHTEGLIGHVARTGQAATVPNYADWPEQEAVLAPYRLKSAIAVPLRHAGAVTAVLVVADRTRVREFIETDREILERFAAQASIAIQTAQIMSREQRIFGQLAILHKISDFIQAARSFDTILHVVLTGMTAGYGLGYNRAALLLLDERGEYLEGRMGIGHLSVEEAARDWQAICENKLDDFNRYLEALEQGHLPLTPIGERVRALRLPVNHAAPDAFTRVVAGGRCMVLDQALWNMLPEPFIECFQPAMPLVVAPLIARSRVIGILAADNKFTAAPITDEDLESLLTFANTAALTIDSHLLFSKTEVARQRLRSFFEASNALVSSQDPEDVLHDIVERVCASVGAVWVSILLIDEIGQVYKAIKTRHGRSFDGPEMIRPDGISIQVLRSGKLEVIENTYQQRKRVNPILFRNGVGSAVCLPLSLKDQRIGVMWIHCDQPRRFSEVELESLQLYVNQAAVGYDSARRIEALERMLHAAEDLAGVNESRAVLEQIGHNAQKVLHADSAAIWLYDTMHHQFVREKSFATNIPAAVWAEFQRAAPRPDGTASTVMREGWVGVSDIRDVHQYGFLGNMTRKLLGQIGAQSFQGICLRLGEEKLGVLYVNYTHPRSFSTEDQQTARIFAKYAALVLKKASLLDQISEAHDTARLVAGVSLQEDLQSTLSSLAEGTRRVLDCDVVTLYAYDQDRQRLSHLPIALGVWFPQHVSHRSGDLGDSLVAQILKRDQPIFAADVTAEPLFRVSDFVQNERIVSCAASPLLAGGKHVGALFVNYRSPHHFSPRDRHTIELFANQASAAIRNDQLFQGHEQQINTLKALHRAGQAVTGTLTLKETLNHIVEQALELVSAKTRAGGFSHLALVEGSILRFTAAHPQQTLEGLQRQIGDIDLTSPPIGITGLAVRSGQSQRVDNVHGVDQYLAYDPAINAELAVPIKVGEQVIGVINMEHPDPAAFDTRDQQALEALAGYAAIAIRNARLYEELSQAKGTVGGMTALAWMGMASSAWRHSIEGSAINIRDAVTVLRPALEAAVPCGLDPTALEMLHLIEANANKIRERPITPPLSSEEGVEAVLISSLINERISQLRQKNETYQSVDYRLFLDQTANARVRVSPEWLRRGLELLIDNAIEAMADSAVREVQIETRVVNDRVEIAIRDTGKGIPPEIESQLFRKQIDKPAGSKGLGMGVLMVLAIVQTYAGAVRVADPGPGSTTMVIELPIYDLHKDGAGGKDNFRHRE